MQGDYKSSIMTDYPFAQHMQRFHPTSETARLLAKVRELEAKYGQLDKLVEEIVKTDRWDDTLVVWAYSKGFQAGLHHASLAVKEKK